VREGVTARASRKDTSLGRELRRLREDRRITQADLAESLKVTQGTVSKSESGRLVPDLDYLSRFVLTLRLDRDTAECLMRLAGVVPDGTTPAKFFQFVPADFLAVNFVERRQETLSLAEARATELLVYQPLLVPGLLQSEDYTRHVVLRAGLRGSKAVERAVRARMRRQNVLGESGRRFVFIMTEAALQARVAPPPILRDQVRCLAEISTESRISVGLVPSSATLPTLPSPPFYVFDDRVYIELPHGDLWLHESSNASDLYRKVFEEFRSAALFGDRFLRALERLSSSL
jgi:transcriptional regulator with XRE-family HTH domain